MFESWMLIKIIKKQVTQDSNHDTKIEVLYGLIKAAVEKEFNEDNDPTITAYLRERFEASLKMNTRNIFSNSLKNNKMNTFDFKTFFKDYINIFNKKSK